MPSWARRWAKALNRGGVLLVVTIRTKSFEQETVPLLATLGVSLLEAARFNNKGYYMCKYYVLAKDGVAAATAGCGAAEVRTREAYRQERKAIVRAQNIAQHMRPALTAGEAVRCGATPRAKP